MMSSAVRISNSSVRASLFRAVFVTCDAKQQLVTTHPPPASRRSFVTVEKFKASDNIKSVQQQSSSTKKKQDDDAYDGKYPFPDKEKEEQILEVQTHVRLHHKHGNYHEALTSSKQLLQVTQNHFGRLHPATASAYNNIGLMHKLLGNYTDSKHNYFESLRVYGDVVGKDHASYAAALHNLGNLFRSQVLMDDTLKSMERLQLLEEAMEYLEQAWEIRKVELGDEHPHTVASLSNLGSTLAKQVLQLCSNNNKTTNNKPSKFTKLKWKVAEQHLRNALQVSIDSTQGDTVKQQPRHHNKGITTLSAAAAAQNLAVFLKYKAIISVQNKQSPPNEEVLLLQEAKELYEAALYVRTELLHEGHPDTVATKHSLAELLEAMGDTKAANVLRNEIMEAYNVKEMDDNDETKQNNNE